MGQSASPVPPPALIAISPGDLDRGAVAGFADRARAAVEGGLGGLLLRELELDDGPLLELAQQLRELLGPHGWLGVHDRVHLALAAGADACHLGFRSLAPAELRAWCGERVGLGLSTHAGDDPASWSAADYLFHGPVRATPSKRGLLDPVGWPGLALAVERAGGRGVWGIGGLEPGDAAQVLATGARGLAVLRGVLGARDPGAAARAHLEALAAAGAQEPGP